MTKKKEFTVKKTGYILQSESIEESLASMRLDKDLIKGEMNFIYSSKKELNKDIGSETPKRVQMTVTVKMEEI